MTNIRIRIKDSRIVEHWNADTQRWECYKPIVENGCLIGIRVWEETPTWSDPLDVVYHIIGEFLDEFLDQGLEAYWISSFELATAWAKISASVEEERD